MNRAVLFVAAFLVALSGCVGALNHPDMRVESALTVADLSDQIHHIRGGVQHFEQTVSVGRFPASIAIVRLDKAVDPETRRQRLTIMPFRGFESPYWMQLFDGTSEIRSLIPIHKKSVRDRYVSMRELVEAAHVLGTGLMLAYGYDNTSTRYTCNVFGLLYEIPSGNLIAGIRHRTTPKDARQAAKGLPSRARPRSLEDWVFYVDHLAFRGLEQKAKKCVWDLIDRDQSTEALKSNPFENFNSSNPRSR